ncbi:hypothetical protein PL11201_730041 [Planktothrix sp. PCC 11201]|nr:hypothetical protein PL11201_730041 [Planktothrix sp. PCC 11201]
MAIKPLKSRSNGAKLFHDFATPNLILNLINIEQVWTVRWSVRP